MNSLVRGLFLLLICDAGTTSAAAGSVIDRVKAEGVLRCGGVERPGLISIDNQGHARGLELDLCRALTAVLLGPTGRLEFRRYDTDHSYDAVRDGSDDIFFLSGAEILDNKLAGKTVPGPIIFNEATAVMVDVNSPIQHLKDLEGQSVCFLTASDAERHLNAWMAANHVSIVRMAYQEQVEMRDAYNVQVCHAVAAETTSLGEERLDGGVAGRQSRILPEPLAVFPIMANTGTQDAQWSAIAAWTVYTLMQADAPQREWESGGIDSLRIVAPELGLEEGWQKRLVDLVGSYGDMFRRNLGSDSPFALDPGVNARFADGGLLMAPYSE